MTGATGFIGRHVAARLAASGMHVGAIGRAPRHTAAAQTPGVEWLYADLLAEDESRRLVAAFRPDILVHAAWYTRHGLFWTAKENTDWRAASIALAEAFRDAGGRRFIGIGSCAEYDWTSPGSVAWPETRPLLPATPYGSAKCEAAARIAALCAEAGMEFGWARLFHLFGADEPPDRLVSSLAIALLAGKEATVGSGRHRRDFCDSAFAGRAIAALAVSRACGPVNIGSGQSVTIAKVARLMGDLCGRSDLVRLGSRPDRPDDPLYLVPDVRRLRTVVGFREQHDLRARLAAAINDQRRCAANMASMA
ncbi:MAG: NAD(P)-dependent oxidoreductase [Rhodospirillales bacterium]|nr:NAD(P)-dependent oxidoreductase [Rhodospirillales bacterium]